MSIKRENIPASLQTQSEIRLIALGDCNTSGIKQSSVPSIVQQLLNQLLRSENKTCRLSNFGEAMRTSREGLSISKNLTQPFDIAVINYGLVDAWITTIPKVYIQYYPDNRVKRIFRKALKSLKKKLKKSYYKSFFKTGPVVSVGEYKQNINKVMSTLHQKNPNILFVLWGTVPVKDEPRNSNLLVYNKALKEQLEKFDGHYIDTQEIISKEPREEMFHDAVHLSGKAQRMIANHIFLKLKSAI